QEEREVQLPAKTTSFREWAQRLALYAQSATATREALYWRGIASKEMPTLPVDMAGENTDRSARSVAVGLGEEDTRDLLQRVPAMHADNPALRIEINELLLAALQQAFAAWMGERDLLIGLEGHGREELTATPQADGAAEVAPIDISRT